MKAVLNYLGAGLLIILAVVALFVVYNTYRGSERLSIPYSLDYDAVEISSDSASIAHGRYLVESHGCTYCHGSDLSGSITVDAPPFRVVAANLTPGRGGIGSTYSDADWLRAIRHGVRPDGRGLFIMPSSQYYYLSDEEVSDLVAYLKSIDPVDNKLEPTEFRLLGTFIAGMSSDFKLEPDMMLDAPRMEMPEFGPTAEWGEYRVSTACTVCHGLDLSGDQPPDPDSPPAPDLRVAAQWEIDEFMDAIRNGITPSGRKLDGDFMPYKAFGKMNDTELTAVHRYLQTL